MTVETTVSRWQYNTNGTTGPWTVGAYFIEDDDLAVTYTNSDGVDALLILGVDYTVAGAGNPAGGTVTTTTAYASGGTVTIVRDPSALQEAEFIDTDPFPAATAMRAWDKAIMLIQRLIGRVDRSFRIPDSEDALAVLPSAAERADNLLGFNSSGDPVALDVSTIGSVSDASLVAFTQTGTGAIGRNMRTKGRDLITVTDFAAMDGVTDDATKLSQAAAEAVARGGLLYWTGENAKVVGNIINFWNARHFGRGSITRGSTVFYINPDRSQTNSLYVATTGSDTNDGLTSDFPFATIQKAFDVIANYAPVLPGRWVVNIAAGTYTETIVVASATRSAYRITIKGPTAGHPNVPTAIIQPAVSSDDIMTFTEGRGWFVVQDVKLQGATTGTAIVLNGCVRVSTINVHIATSLTGVTSQHNSFFSSSGGIWTGRGKAVSGGVGLTSQYASTHSFTGTGSVDGTQITAFERGLLINEGANGHLDGIQVSNCAIGMAIKRGAGECNTDNMLIKTCDLGIEARQGWFNNGITFGTGADANTVNVRPLGNAPEYDFSTEDHQTKTVRLIESQYGISHTGTTSETQVYEFADIRSWMISEGGHAFKIVMNINGTSLAGTCTIRLVFVDGTPTEDSLCTIILPSGTTDAVVEGQINCSSSNAQRAILTAVHNAGALCGAYGTGALAMANTGGRIRVKLTLSNAADTVNIRWLELHSTIGG